MFASGRSARTRRQTSGPSIFGIIQSRIASVGSVACAQVLPRQLAVGDDRRVVVPPAERPREDLAGDAIVFRDQNLHGAVREYTNSVGPARRIAQFRDSACTSWAALPAGVAWNGRCTMSASARGDARTSA